VRRGLRRGRELRSARLAGTSLVARANHLCAVRRLIPAASAARVTAQPDSRTRLTSSARLAGHVRAPLWRFIRGSLRPVVDGLEHHQLLSEGPRLNSLTV